MNSDIEVKNIAKFTQLWYEISIYELNKRIEIFMHDGYSNTDREIDIYAHLYQTCCCHAISWQTGAGTWKELTARYEALAEEYPEI